MPFSSFPIELSWMKEWWLLEGEDDVVTELTTDLPLVTGELRLNSTDMLCLFLEDETADS